MIRGWCTHHILCARPTNTRKISASSAGLLRKLYDYSHQSRPRAARTHRDEIRFLLWQASKRLNDGVAFHALMIRDRAQNGIQRSDAKVFVDGNGEALV